MQKERLSVLVAPMDWGLGHATRCIPLVKALQNFGIEVIIAAEGAQLLLLRNEFPHLKFIHLQGYRIQYSNSKRLLPFKIALQIPKILFTIRKENVWLKKVIRQFNIQAVVSDNRYGLHNKNVLSVFVTHQLSVQTPQKNITDLIRYLNFQFIKNFDECWVPDHSDEKNNIAGALSHPPRLPDSSVHYIGPLSRFSEMTTSSRFDHTALISGPEPQRSIFEAKIRKHFAYLSGTKCIVLGKPGNNTKENGEQNLQVYDHLNAEELQDVIASSKNIICRAGYSTIMDLIAMKKSALLVPTPGQTEQEYLSRYLSRKNWFSFVSQENLNAAAIMQAADASHVIPQLPTNDVENFIAGFVARLKKK